MAQAGDKFFPMAGFTTVALGEGRVGIEISWAESEQDAQTGQFKTARLLFSAERANQLAGDLRSQAAIALQRDRPN